MSRVYPLLTVLAVVTSSGALHGVWTNRWAPSGALEWASARLADLPMTLGDWDGQADELDARQAAVAGASGSVLRRYVNRRTGAVVSLLLVCGRPGPVSVHVPEVCYRGGGYELAGARQRQSAPAGAGEYWTCQFQKRRAAGPEERLRVLYAWNATGEWEAPDSARTHFALRPALYKFMVVRQMPREDEPLEEGPSAEFLKVLLPAAKRALFPAH